MDLGTNSSHLVLGLGNDLLSDDAIGPIIVKKLNQNFSDKNITYRVAAVGGMDLIELIEGFEKVIIIDGIKSANGIPGKLYKYTSTDFEETLHLSSFHNTDFKTTIELALRLNIQIPQHIDIFAIEIVKDLEFSKDLSSELKSKFNSIYEQILVFLKDWVKV